MRCQKTLVNLENIDQRKNKNKFSVQFLDISVNFYLKTRFILDGR